jgi:hypothetical protein
MSADTAIAMMGQWLLSSEPRKVGMRQATRPERRSLADSYQMKGSLYMLSCGFAKGSLG